MQSTHVCVCEYLEFLWEEGEGVNKAAVTLSGLQNEICMLKAHLSEAWQLSGVWRRYDLPVRALVLTRDQVEAMAGFACKDNRWDLATAFIVGFTEFLRTGEILNISAADCDFDLKSIKVIIDLGFTKSGHVAKKLRTNKHSQHTPYESQHQAKSRSVQTRLVSVCCCSESTYAY